MNILLGHGSKLICGLVLSLEQSRKDGHGIVIIHIDISCSGVPVPKV